MVLDIAAASRKDRKRARHARAFLNGVEVCDCYYGDTRLGIILAYVRREDGFVHRGANRQPERTVLRGRVTLQVRRRNRLY